MAVAVERFIKFILVVLTVLALTAFGEINFARAEEPPAQRSLEVELEEVEGATAYEIELKSVVTNRVSVFKMKKPLWKAKVKPGKYKMRLRSYDDRGVAGDWSPPDEFLVAFAAPMLVSPKQNAFIKNDTDEKSDLQFSWQHVPGAEKYRIDIYDVTAAGTGESAAAPATPAPLAATQVIENANSTKISLPVARRYQWKVTAIMPTGEDGEALTDLGVFTSVAKKLDPPEIERPMDRYVQKITWEKPARAETFTYSLSRQEGNAWKTVEKKTGVSANEIDFAHNIPGGLYRLQVRSDAAHTESSQIVKMEFDVFKGDRSPAAVETMRLRDSMEKPNTWYAIASYLITNVTYQGVNAEGSAGAQQVAFPNALGGTGRLGLGYFKPNSPTGYIGILDFGGMNISGDNVTFASLEGHYAKRYYFGTNQLRLSGGLFYKELPQTFQTDGGTFEHKKISYYGPHIGADFWHPFSFKYGFQLNSRLYVAALTGSTPNGEPILMTPSYQVGAMGTIRLSRDLIGFAGLARRQDSIKYKKGSSAVSTSVDNEVTLSGNYLNLMLEYGF